MAKDPAFLFYPNDYIGGTMGMSFEEKGAYVELLMVQFNRGHMTTHMITQAVGQHWDNIQHKFVQDKDGLWYNLRLEREILLRKKFTESRRNNLSGKNQYTKIDNVESVQMGGLVTSHMENENINEDINIDEGGTGEKKEAPETEIKVPEIEVPEIDIREAEFIQECESFSAQYGEAMIKDFIRYWTEKNKSKTKMRFEREATWETPRRLITWSNNEKAFSNGKSTNRELSHNTYSEKAGQTTL